MLKLAAATDPSWAAWAAGHRDEILVDHAHCEKKAAGAAVNLLFRYPEHAALQEPLAALAREELAHFEAMLAQLRRLGIAFGRQRPGPYAGRLHAFARSEEPGRLVDLLLCCAVIEARSCERLQLLGPKLGDPELAEFYRGLFRAEARHYRVYVELAEAVAGPRAVAERLPRALAHEAEVLESSPLLPRLHAGGKLLRGRQG